MQIRVYIHVCVCVCVGVNSGLVGRRVTRQGNGRLEGFAGGFFPDHEEAANTQINPVRVCARARVRMCECVDRNAQANARVHEQAPSRTHAGNRKKASKHTQVPATSGWVFIARCDIGGKAPEGILHALACRVARGCLYAYTCDAHQHELPPLFQEPSNWASWRISIPHIYSCMHTQTTIHGHGQ